jgi:hypothetical protein
MGVAGDHNAWKLCMDPLCSTKSKMTRWWWIKIPVLWDSCTLTDRYWYFRETYCLCLQCRGTFLDIYKFPASKFCSEVTSEMKCYMFWTKPEGTWVNRICRVTKKWLFKLPSAVHYLSTDLLCRIRKAEIWFVLIWFFWTVSSWSSIVPVQCILETQISRIVPTDKLVSQDLFMIFSLQHFCSQNTLQTY